MARVWRAVCSHKEILLLCFWVSDFISTLLKEKIEITQVEKDNGCHQTLLTNIILLIADQGDDTKQDLLLSTTWRQRKQDSEEQKAQQAALLSDSLPGPTTSKFHRG